MSDVLCDCRGPGARVNGDCAVLREFRMLLSPGGREQLLFEYRTEISRRELEREGGGAPADTHFRLQRMGVPQLALLGLRGAKPNAALDGARTFVNAPREAIQYLLLVGATGVGKSVAAAWVLQQFAQRYPWDSQPTRGERQPALFVEARQLTRLSNFDAQQTAWLEELTAVQLLVLDDIGDEGTDAGRNALIDLCITRGDRGRRTVLTSNLTGETFKTRYGVALADRIRQRGIIPNLQGAPSMRRRSAA